MPTTNAAVDKTAEKAGTTKVHEKLAERRRDSGTPKRSRSKGGDEDEARSHEMPVGLRAVLRTMPALSARLKHRSNGLWRVPACFALLWDQNTGRNSR